MIHIYIIHIIHACFNMDNLKCWVICVQVSYCGSLWDIHRFDELLWISRKDAIAGLLLLNPSKAKLFLFWLSKTSRADKGKTIGVTWGNIQTYWADSWKAFLVPQIKCPKCSRRRVFLDHVIEKKTSICSVVHVLAEKGICGVLKFAFYIHQALQRSVLCKRILVISARRPVS